MNLKKTRWKFESYWRQLERKIEENLEDGECELYNNLNKNKFK